MSVGGFQKNMEDVRVRTMKQKRPTCPTSM
jgi:hypothetical protein